MFGNGAPFSYSPRGFVPEERPQLRRSFNQSEPRSAPWPRNNTSRPSGKTIYTQRKEHIETLNKQDNIHYRVEHLFTCDLNGHDANSLDDCMAKLRNLDAKGQLWPQDMILDVQGGYLQLKDMETKMELEALPLGSLLQTNTVLDSCAYNSLLALTVQERFKRTAQVYIFQCEEVGAEFIKSDLDKAVQGKPAYVDDHSDQFNIRNDMENGTGQWAPGGPRPRAMLDRPPSPLEDPGLQWRSRDFEPPPPASYAQTYTPSSHDSQYYAEMELERQDRHEAPPMAEYSETERDTEILNHVLSDVELFMGMLAASRPPESQGGKGKKKAHKMKKSSKKGASLPPVDHYIEYLQKVKYGFNLLGRLDGHLTIPSAADFVHIFFSSLRIVVPQYTPGISDRVLSPMLTEPALQLLDKETTPEEDQLWRSLGECWNVPRTKWPDGDAVPPYMPKFSDGWQIPPRPQTSRMGAVQRTNSQRFAPRGGPLYDGLGGREMQGPPEESRNGWSSAAPPRQGEPPLRMRVIYDFMARNNQELSLQKGDVVQVIDNSKQWWLVRNNLQEEGHVPQNVLEPMNESVPLDYPQEPRGRGPPLDLTSSPADVRAWLDFKGFSKITVASIGVLNGKQLLGLSRENLRLACPDEGGKLFFQLQPVKSAIALASEPRYGAYNGGY